MTSKLLREAIADAKLIKEVAVENAMTQLKESFQPSIKRLIDKKLNEEELEDDQLLTDTEDVVEEEFPAEDELSEEGEEMNVPLEDDDELDEILRELEEEEPMIPEEEIPIEEEEMPVEDDLTEEGEVGDDELDEMLRELEGGCDDTTKNENKILQKKLREAYQVVNKQRSVIKEVTLLNSKLMYATKLNNGYNLSESTKLRILRTFDKATTMNEVKMAYNAILAGLNSNRKPKVAQRKTIKEITNAFVPGKPVITEDKNIIPVNRWQELAGIK